MHIICQKQGHWALIAARGDASHGAVATGEEQLASCAAEQSKCCSICTVTLDLCGDLRFMSWASPKVPPSETSCSEASASTKMPLSEVLLSLVPRSEASASSGVPLSEVPTPRGTTLLSCLVQEGEEIVCVIGRNEHSVHGRASSRRRQRGFGQQRGAAQREADAARDGFVRRKRSTNRS
jgi:hypothetical protein